MRDFNRVLMHLRLKFMYRLDECLQDHFLCRMHRTSNSNEGMRQ